MAPESVKLTADGWRRLMAKFGLAAHLDTHARLLKAYGEPHRRYHNLDHVNACFEHLGAVEALAERPHEIELALWFHDAVYEIFSSTNEEDSAEMARVFLVGEGVDAAIIDRIYALIMVTKDHDGPQTVDEKLMLDIDLSILGAAPDVYAQYEKNVRAEYRMIPWFLFRSKRKEILRSFLAKPRIYHSEYFTEQFEAQARGNLETAITALK